jgi:hypothetical protein
MEVFLPPQKKVVSPRVYYFGIPGSFDLFTLDFFPPFVGVLAVEGRIYIRKMTGRPAVLFQTELDGKTIVPFLSHSRRDKMKTSFDIRIH